MSDKKIVSIEDRMPKLKQARKKKANRRLIFYLSIFFFLIFIIIYLQSPLSHIKSIQVNGNEFVADEQIINLSELNTQMNIWMIDIPSIESKIVENPVIESVKITRNLPWTIQIDIMEHLVIGYVEKDDLYFPVLGNGVILKDAEQKTFNGSAPLLKNFTEEDYLHKMAEELNKLPDSVASLISEITWIPEKDNKNKILLYMNDGYTVHGTIRDFSNNMQVYPSVISQLDPEVDGIIHIGVGVYFEPIGEEPSNDQEEETNGVQEDESN